MTKTETTGPNVDKKIDVTGPEPKPETNVDKRIDGYTSFPKVITSAELSIIVSDLTESDYDGRKIRTVLRRIIPSDGYTKYRFDYPSETVRRIVRTFLRIESERSDKRKRTVENRNRTNRKNNVVIEIDGSGSVTTKNDTSETDGTL